MNPFRKKMFRGAKIEDIILQLERLTNQNKERAERYANTDLWPNTNAELHEGIYQGNKDALEMLKEEFGYTSERNA